MSLWRKALNVFLGTIAGGCAIVVAQPSFNVSRALGVPQPTELSVGGFQEEGKVQEPVACSLLKNAQE